MTVLAAEAGATAVEGEAAAASSTAATEARSATASGGRPAPVRRGPGQPPRRGGRPRTGGRTSQGTSGTRRVSTAKPAPAASQGRSQGRQGGSKRKGQPITFGGGSASQSNYHAVILAEFVLAVLLVAATPFAKKNQAGVSPYAGRDMVQLLSLTLLYFLLALLAGTGGQRARFSAWFGGLILLTVGLGEAATIAKAVTTFFGAGPAQPQGSSDQVDNPDITAGVAGAALNALGPAAGVSRNVPQDPRSKGASN